MSTIDDAVTELRSGRLVVIPTDTVYGLAALPAHPGAIEALFRLKGRPTDKALPVLGADTEALRAVAQMDDAAARVAAAFWPGPVTLVLPRAAGFDHYLGDVDESSIAVRVPASSLARSLLEVVGPVAVTSANRSGRVPANTIDEARTALGDAVAVYLDDGPGGGSPSTVVSLMKEPRVLREGAVPADEVLAVLDL